MRKMFLVAALLAAISPAHAQQGLYPKTSQPWFPQGKVSGGVSASGSSAATALPTVGFQAWVCNTGSNDAYLAFGGSSVAATTTGGSWLKAGTCATYDLFALPTKATHIAAITASSTTTLSVETGAGNGPALTSSGGGGGGGGGTSSSFAAAFPGTGTAAGFNASNGNMAPANLDASGNLKTSVQNFNANGQATAANSAPTVLASDQPAIPVGKASATGGATQYHLVAANSNNATTVKNSAGTVYSAQLGGLGSAPAYLKFYDKSTTPTCNSDTVKKTLIIPAASTAANGGGSNIIFGPTGIAFASGISFCVVTGIADNDNTSVAAATFTINFDYQ